MGTTPCWRVLLLAAILLYIAPGFAQQQPSDACSSISQRCNSACSKLGAKLGSFSCSVATGQGMDVKCRCDNGDEPKVEGDGAVQQGPAAAITGTPAPGMTSPGSTAAGVAAPPTGPGAAHRASMESFTLLACCVLTARLIVLCA